MSLREFFAHARIRIAVERVLRRRETRLFASSTSTATSAREDCDGFLQTIRGMRRFPPVEHVVGNHPCRAEVRSQSTEEITNYGVVVRPVPKGAMALFEIHSCSC